MPQRIQQDLDELEKAGVITADSASAIRSYYAARPHPPAPNRLLIAFGIIGAILVGSGILLIFAHNWDDMPRWIRTILAFLPLLTGQAVCLFALLRKSDARVWHEAGAVLTFIAVATAIALVHQIYNLPEHHISRFMAAWALLTIPLMFLIRSAASSLLYLGIVSWYAIETMDKGWGNSEALSPWWFFALILP